MRLKLLVLSSFISVLVPFLTTLGYANRVVIFQIQGTEVEFQKSGKTKWKQAQGGQTLESGDKVRTGKKGRAILLSQEGHKILIKQETVLQLSKLGPVEWEFQEEVGRVRLKVSKLGDQQSLKVKTPTAVCSVRGTDYQVSTFEDGRTEVDVYNGIVSLSNGRDPEIDLHENERSRVGSEGSVPTPPEKIPENERPQDPGFGSAPKGVGQPGMAGVPGAPMDDKSRNQWQALHQQLSQLDPKDKEGQEKVKDEMKSFMKERFEDSMKNFKGSEEDKARIEKEFMNQMDNFDKYVEKREFNQGPMEPRGPMDPKVEKEMRELESKFRNLDPKDSEGRDKLEKERMELMQKSGMMEGSPFGPRMGDMAMGPGMMGMGPGPLGTPPGEYGPEFGVPKEEMVTHMQEGFDRFMKDFDGTPEEREMFEKTFKEEMGRFEREEFGPPSGWQDQRGMGDYDRPNPDERNKDNRDRQGNNERSWWDGGKDDFRDEIRDEVHNDQNRDYYQDSVKDDLFTDLAQTSKSLIDSSGRRVRLEENIVYIPPSNTFKFVSLSKRENRNDSVVFEVVANQTLPERLEDAGNLWFHSEPRKPQWYVTKQRLTITNGPDENSGTDRIVQLFLEGDSKEITSSNSFYQDGKYVTTSGRSFQTIFDHRYEFINGEKRTTDNMWTNFNRNDPLRDAPGMMWHMRPVYKQMYDENRGVTSSFWDYTFITTSGNGDTAIGKMTVTQFQPGSGPTIAHFIQTNNYINFVDTNNNGRLDKGETFQDTNKNGTRDEGEPYLDEASIGLNGAGGNREYNGTADGTSDKPAFFSDLNRNNQKDNDEFSTNDPYALLARTRPWAFLKEQMLLIDDFGKIQDFTQLGFGSKEELDRNPEAMADLFEKLNMERVFTSSEFGTRNIDAIMTPRTFMKAKMLDFKMEGNQDIYTRR